MFDQTDTEAKLETAVTASIERIKEWDLYVISDLELAGGKSYPEIFESVLRSGVRVMQLRDKETPFEDLVLLGRRLMKMCRQFEAQLIINDNPYLAKEIDADGVHLGQLDCPVEIARDIVGREKIVGVSTHNVAQALKAQMSDADYIAIGPIFETQTKRAAGGALGATMVRWAREHLKKPFVCIGGIQQHNIRELMEQGARCCAVISAVMGAPDMQLAASNLRAMIREHLPVETFDASE